MPLFIRKTKSSVEAIFKCPVVIKKIVNNVTEKKV